MLTDKGKALLKYVNDPKNKARFKKMNKEIERQELEEEAKKLWQRILREQGNKQIKKQIIGFTILILILGFVVWLTIW